MLFFIILFYPNFACPLSIFSFQSSLTPSVSLSLSLSLSPSSFITLLLILCLEQFTTPSRYCSILLYSFFVDFWYRLFLLWLTRFEHTLFWNHFHQQVPISREIKISGLTYLHSPFFLPFHNSNSWSFDSRISTRGLNWRRHEEEQKKKRVLKRRRRGTEKRIPGSPYRFVQTVRLSLTKSLPPFLKTKLLCCSYCSNILYTTRSNLALSRYFEALLSELPNLPSHWNGHYFDWNPLRPKQSPSSIHLTSSVHSFDPTHFDHLPYRYLATIHIDNSSFRFEYLYTNWTYFNIHISIYTRICL